MHDYDTLIFETDILGKKLSIFQWIGNPEVNIKQIPSLLFEIITIVKGHEKKPNNIGFRRFEFIQI